MLEEWYGQTLVRLKKSSHSALFNLGGLDHLELLCFFVTTEVTAETRQPWRSRVEAPVLG